MFGLICLGELKNHKARARFYRGFLAPGGIDSKRSGESQSHQDVLAFYQRIKEMHFYVLCGSDTQYARVWFKSSKVIQ